jgi:hypothetical protein
MPDILVIGSMNADLVVRTPRFPQPGETISGEDLQIIPGGKGANQAIAATRQGVSVTMVGRVGNDIWTSTYQHPNGTTDISTCSGFDLQPHRTNVVREWANSMTYPGATQQSPRSGDVSSQMLLLLPN